MIEIDVEVLIEKRRYFVHLSWGYCAMWSVIRTLALHSRDSLMFADFLG